MCFVCMTEQMEIISLCRINFCFFITQTHWFTVWYKLNPQIQCSPVRTVAAQLCCTVGAVPLQFLLQLVSPAALLLSIFEIFLCQQYTCLVLFPHINIRMLYSTLCCPNVQSSTILVWCCVCIFCIYVGSNAFTCNAAVSQCMLLGCM